MSISQLVAEAQFDVIRIREVRTQILAEDGFQRLPPPRPRSDYRRYTYRDGKKIIQPHSSGGTKPLTEAERADALDKALKILEAVTRPPPPSVDKMLRSIEKIATLDRYERRAVSRRKRALRLLHEDYKRGVKPRRASPSNQNSK
jgi:hypothetical protein